VGRAAEFDTSLADGSEDLLGIIILSFLEQSKIKKQQ
jgi:hypothetical protein